MKKVVLMGVLLASILLLTRCSAKSNINTNSNITSWNTEAHTNLFAVPQAIEMNEKVYFSVNSHELSIFGEGPAYGGATGKFPWKSNGLNIHSVRVFDDISYISPYGFANMNIQCCEITAPIVEMGMGLFQNSSIVSVDIMATKITRLPMEMFASCSSLETVYLPSSLISIGSYAFYSTSSIQTIYYPGSQEQWQEILIEEGNDPLNQATIICNYRKE